MAWGAQTGKNADKVPEMTPMGRHTKREIEKHYNGKGKGREDERAQKDHKGREIGNKQGEIWSGTKKKGWFS